PAFSPASVGLAMRDVSIRIIPIDADSDEGEVAIAAPSMFSGYVHEQPALVDGHFATGDLGRLDAHGNLSITGRTRLLIDTGGLKVNPVEVESVLASHPDVAECVVLPMAQSQTVQRLRALVVPRDPAHPPTAEFIRQFARERLAAYKVPRV